MSGAPLLVVHGHADAVVESEHGMDVYGRARPPKALLTVLPRGHSEYVQEEPETAADAVVVDVSRAFLETVLAGSVRRPRVERELAWLDSEGTW